MKFIAENGATLTTAEMLQLAGIVAAFLLVAFVWAMIQRASGVKRVKVQHHHGCCALPVIVLVGLAVVMKVITGP